MEEEDMRNQMVTRTPNFFKRNLDEEAKKRMSIEKIKQHEDQLSMERITIDLPNIANNSSNYNGPITVDNKA